MLRAVSSDQAGATPTTPGLAYARPQQIPFIASAAAVSWGSMPAAATGFNSTNRCLTKYDLTRFTQARLVSTILTTGATNAIIAVRYSTTFTTTVASFLPLGASSTDIKVAIAVSPPLVVASSWTDITALALADVYLFLVGEGGDASASPGFGLTALQVR